MHANGAGPAESQRRRCLNADGEEVGVEEEEEEEDADDLVAAG